MTTAQYLAALKRLGLSPHGIKTRKALGLSARQLARLAKGNDVTRTLERLLLMYLKAPELFSQINDGPTQIDWRQELRRRA